MSTATEVRERPILFTGPMVRAILDDRKTQTRRIVVPQPDKGFYDPQIGPGWICAWFRVRNDKNEWHDVKAPYQPGDLLYVRETWAALIPGGNFDEITGPPSHMPHYADVRYQATERLADLDTETRGYRWRPSIHMPKALARIWLEVTGVRVECLWDITEDDAKAEGCVESTHELPEMEGIRIGGLTIGPGATEWHSASGNFQILWEGLNAKRGYGWDRKPWVWAYTFRRIEQDGP